MYECMCVCMYVCLYICVSVPMYYHSGFSSIKISFRIVAGFQIHLTCYVKEILFYHNNKIYHRWLI